MPRGLSRRGSPVRNRTESSESSCHKAKELSSRPCWPVYHVPSRFTHQNLSLPTHSGVQFHVPDRRRTSVPLDEENRSSGIKSVPQPSGYFGRCPSGDGE